MASIKNRLINSYKTELENPLFFYRYLRIRLIWVALICILIGVLDGLGLTMFLPMLQIAEGANEVNPDEMGKLRYFFEFLQSNGLELNLHLILGFLCFFFIMKGVIIYLGNAYRVMTQQYFVKKIRFETLDLISNIVFKEFVNLDVGRIQNTMTAEIGRLSMALSSYLFAIQHIILVIVYVGFAVIINPQFSLLVAGGGFVSNFFLKKIFKFTRKASQILTNETHLYQGLIIQFINNFKYLKATGVKPMMYDKLGNQILRIEANNKRIGMLAAVMTAVREPIMILVVAAAILIQTEIVGGSLTEILISLIFFYRALSSLVNVQAQWNSFLAVSGSLSNMMDFQNELRSHQEKKQPLFDKRFQDKIILKGVHLNYGDKTVLKDINLEIKRNETIAIVGESGSGKTSLLNILSCLVSPSSGEYQIDGENIVHMNPVIFQKRIGYITQEPIIFNTSIYDNITLWSHKKREENDHFETVIRQASIQQFIDEQKDREQMDLGISGINLSGGQKQRISIARELYKEVDVLILDEATSALDTETERIIQNNIDALKGKFTMIIVAHRLSTVKNADRIVLMKNAEIQAIGNYAELLENAPYFKRMVELQELN